MTSKRDNILVVQYLKCKVKHFLGIEKNYGIFPFYDDALYGI